jgi:hypothetical protein
MKDCKPVSTPMDAYPVESQSDAEICPKDIPYRNIVGGLLYLAQNTRPDIMFTVNYLTRFYNNYTAQHWNIAKRVLRYLKGTKARGLNYPFTTKEETHSLWGYTDADFAGELSSKNSDALTDSTKAKSVSGYAIYLGKYPLSFRSTKQDLVATSTTHAECIALCEGAKEMMYLRNLLLELDLINKEPCLLLCDNNGSIEISKYTNNYQRSKHFLIRLHYIRELQANKEVNVEYIKSASNVADILTKPLKRVTHEKLTGQLLGSAEHSTSK